MRSTYKCGGAGKHGVPPKECTRCGRRHPKGKKQKAKAQEMGWATCKSVAANRNKKSSFTPVVSTISSAFDEAKRQASNIRNRERSAAAKAERIKNASSKPKRSSKEQIAWLDSKFGVGKGAKKERKKLLDSVT